MKSKFDICLELLTKEASNISRASGLGRVGQLLSGSRARALEARSTQQFGAGHRAWRALQNPERTHDELSLARRVAANTSGQARAGRAAREESSNVLKARLIGAGALGAGAVGAGLAGGEPEETVDGAPPKKSPYLEGAKVLGSSLAGFGLGQLAGAGIGKGIEHFTQRSGGDPVRIAAKVAPIVGTAAGVIYPMWRAREQKEITDAVESARDENERRLPGQ